MRRKSSQISAIFTHLEVGENLKLVEVSIEIDNL